MSNGTQKGLIKWLRERDPLWAFLGFALVGVGGLVIAGLTLWFNRVDVKRAKEEAKQATADAKESKQIADRAALAAEKSARTADDALALANKAYTHSTNEAWLSRIQKARMEGPELILNILPRMVTNNQTISFTYGIVLQNVGRDAARNVSIHLLNTVYGGQRYNGEVDPVLYRVPEPIKRLEAGTGYTNWVPHPKLRRLAWNTDDFVVTDAGCQLQCGITYSGTDTLERTNSAIATFSAGNGKFDVKASPMELVSQEVK